MTKKHFIEFAKCAKHMVDSGNIEEARAIFWAVWNVQDNPNFDRYKFLTACGLTEVDVQDVSLEGINKF